MRWPAACRRIWSEGCRKRSVANEEPHKLVGRIAKRRRAKLGEGGTNKVSHNGVGLLNHQEVGHHAKAEDDKGTTSESAAVVYLGLQTVLICSELLKAGRKEEHTRPALKGQDIPDV